METKKILIIAGSGGHSTQALILFNELKKSAHQIAFLLERGDQLTIDKLSGEDIYTAIAIRGKSETRMTTFFRIITCFFQSLVIFFKAKPDVLISPGPGLAIPIFLIGKLFHKKLIFIESWSRVTDKSIAGKILYRYCHLFFIQWPEAQEIYPSGTYAGRLG